MSELLRGEPSWVRHAIFWHVYPLGALDAPATREDADPEAGPDGVAHRLPRLHAWLDHLLEIGCNGLLLGPVFSSYSHGYDTWDHHAVDPRLGTETDLTDLISACHERGIRVGLDGVFNHVGREHPLAKRALERGSATYFEGHTGLVNLDHEDDAVLDLIIDVLRYWSARGVDCWRMDAAYAMAPEVWQRILPAVRAEFPDLYVFGEVIHGDYPAIVESSGFDAVTQYELWKATWSALNDANLYELDHALTRHAKFSETFIAQTFLSNHDVTRIASRLTDPRHLRHAVALLTHLPGTPSIYYGDEDGFTGIKYERLGGDAEIRPPLPANPAELSELGASTRAMYQELVGSRRRHPWLHEAYLETSDLTNTTLAIRLTARDGVGAVTLALNIGDEDARVADRRVAAHGIKIWEETGR
ncbi:MAG: alpha-amylase family glycosyl hydrolase [Bowdeniella nasicola]|nr:alpha-amylase family glycosyl hydrolase [Bowdeniella nasicola]